MAAKSRNNAVAKGATAEIIKWHNIAHDRLCGTWEAYVKCGELLTAEQAKLNHGEWIPWIEANLPFGRSQAWRYMRCYEQRHETNVASKQHLTLENVARIAIQPEPEPADKPEANKRELVFVPGQERPVLLGGRPLPTMTTDIRINDPNGAKDRAKEQAKHHLGLACSWAPRGSISGDELLEMLRTLLLEYRLN